MDQFTLIKNRVFSCSVPLKGVHQSYVVDGNLLKESDYNGIVQLSKGDLSNNDYRDSSFEVCTKMERFDMQKGSAFKDECKGIKIDTSKSNALQLISVREKRDSNACGSYIIDIEANSKKGENSTLLICYHNIESIRYETNERIKINVEDGCGLELIVLQNENGKSVHNVHYDIQIGKEASFKLNLITLHGGYITNTIDAIMVGERGECILNGLYLADKEQVVNTKVNLLHKVGECVSNQLFKGILDGNSKTDFAGEIVVASQAQKTEAYQSNNNLLISESAKATSDPHLIIYADDVKCSHGSTVGTVGEEELFYMRSRGISEKEAKLLQQQAFAASVIEKITNLELRERLMGFVERRLRGDDIFCGDCSVRCCQ